MDDQVWLLLAIPCWPADCCRMRLKESRLCRGSSRCPMIVSLRSSNQSSIFIESTIVHRSGSSSHRNCFGSNGGDLCTSCVGFPNTHWNRIHTMAFYKILTLLQCSGQVSCAVEYPNTLASGMSSSRKKQACPKTATGEEPLVCWGSRALR